MKDRRTVQELLEEYGFDSNLLNEAIADNTPLKKYVTNFETTEENPGPPPKAWAIIQKAEKEILQYLKSRAEGWTIKQQNKPSKADSNFSFQMTKGKNKATLYYQESYEEDHSDEGENLGRSYVDTFITLMVNNKVFSYGQIKTFGDIAKALNNVK